MTKSRWIKFSGWLMAAGGLTLLLGWMASSRPEYSQYNAASWPVDRYLNAAVFPLIFVGFLMITVSLFGLNARFSVQSSPLGRAGYFISIFGSLLAMVAMAALELLDSSPWWETTMLAVTAMFLGLALFGLDSLRHRWFDRWSFVPLLASLPWLVAIAVTLISLALTGRSFQMPDTLITLLFVLTFGGLALTGYLVQASTIDQPSVSAA